MKHDVDVLIVGGGIVGCGIFRDLALHGISTCLIEKGDFNSQTSSRSSKMLHGGIRYLEHFEFGLVKEALHEKNLWLKLAPHLCKELPFCMPIYQDSKLPLWQLSIGLKIYDFLSGYENSPHRVLGKRKTVHQYPMLRKNGLRGSGQYYDAVVDDAQLGLECLYDGLLEKNSECFNYTEMIDFQPWENSVRVTVKNNFSGKEREITAKEIVFALGPFTDQVLARFIPHWRPVLLPSKGIHLWIKKSSLPIENPVVLLTKSGRVIFLIPQKGAILVGTTEDQTTEEFYNIKALPQEIDYLLANINVYLEGITLNESDIISTFAGVRPLIKDERSQRPGSTSREHKIFYPYHNVKVIAGGKYTTFRKMAQDIAGPLVLKLGQSYSNTKTLHPLRQKSMVNPFALSDLSQINFQQLVKNENVKTIDDLIKRRIGLPLGDNQGIEHPLLSNIKLQLKNLGLPHQR
jgi:glycerol-3-phosphate dehydrogenase